MDLQGIPMLALRGSSKRESFLSVRRDARANPSWVKMMQRDGGCNYFLGKYSRGSGGHRLAACFAFIKLALSRSLSSPPFLPF